MLSSLLLQHFFAMRPSGFPLKIRKDGRSVPSAVIVTATVTRFVSFVDVRMWMVFFPMTSRVRFELIEKKTGVWSMLMMKRRSRLAHESHEVCGLAFNFGWRSLRSVRAHSI